MKILILDNYDSFTYNLFHYAEQFCNRVDIARNDEIALDRIQEYDKIILSPGPGLPCDAGVMPHLIARYAATKSILGICLGMQGIVEHFGGALHNLPEVKHGLQRKCNVVAWDVVFQGVPNEFLAGRYHSWGVSPEQIGPHLKVLALDQENLVMAVRHKKYNVLGLQFHPESIMTPHGLKMIENWINAKPTETAH